MSCLGPQDEDVLTRMDMGIKRVVAYFQRSCSQPKVEAEFFLAGWLHVRYDGS